MVRILKLGMIYTPHLMSVIPLMTVPLPAVGPAPTAQRNRTAWKASSPAPCSWLTADESFVKLVCRAQVLYSYTGLLLVGHAPCGHAQPRLYGPPRSAQHALASPQTVGKQHNACSATALVSPATQVSSGHAEACCTHLELFRAAWERLHRHQLAAGGLHRQQRGHPLHDVVVPAQAAAHGASQGVRPSIAEIPYAQAGGICLGPCASRVSSWLSGAGGGVS